MDKVLERVMKRAHDSFKDRSCRNCAHRTGIGGAWDWNCARYGGFILSIAIEERYCGTNLRGWVTRRSLWERLITSGTGDARSEG